MEVETRFGKVVTRENATSLQRSHAILLKDNMHLKPLFDWLKHLKVKTVNDFKSEKLVNMMKEIDFNREIKFGFEEEPPMMVFRNIAPLQGDFQKGIQEYLDLLYKAMYSPEEVYL
ncbi:MAG: hypothetical protein N2112_17150 [Gemmataceae bacterium]|nr:hypothetical protein [Gemmataceae bacterium]